MNYLKYFREFILYSTAWLWYRKTAQRLFWAQTSCLWFKRSWSFDVKWEASSPGVRWPRLLRYWLLGKPWRLVGELVQSGPLLKWESPAHLHFWPLRPWSFWCWTSGGIQQKTLWKYTRARLSRTCLFLNLSEISIGGSKALVKHSSDLFPFTKEIFLSTHALRNKTVFNFLWLEEVH